MNQPTASPASTDDGTPFTDVQAAEASVIARQRLNRGITDPATPLLGLALSGGGIRSASFALGVLQALARKDGVHTDRLRDVDYLSTVSGGGYIGSSLTWFNYLQRSRPPAQRQFPFGSKSEAHREQCAAGVSPDNTAFIRQHGEYMTPAKRFTSASLIAVALRNMLLCSSVYFALVVAMTMAALLAHPYWRSVMPRGWLRENISENMLPAVLLLLLFMVASILFGMSTAIIPKLNPKNEVLYEWRVRSQRYFGLLLVWAFVAFICGTVPHTYASIEHWKATGFALSTTGGAGVIYEFLKQQRPKLAAALPKTNLIILWVTVLAITYGLLLGAFALAIKLDPHASKPWLPLCFVGYALAVGGIMNSNMFSIGRMYRDRLMEAFMPNPDAVAKRKWLRAQQADVAFLQDVCTEADNGPYHLVNTNVVLTSTDHATYRGRGGDSFVFSPRYSGSEATGWHETAKMCGSMSLATAMAISGAAINPNAACGGRGPTRNRLASFVLALFNIRLGYWVKNPNAGIRGKIASKIWPNLIYPGLRQGLLGTGLHVRAGYIELTDGGHYDNTGIYELVRRKVPRIILSLASADPEYGFDDLADVVERVRVDFGVYIEFDTMLQGAIPGPSTPPPAGIACALKFAPSSHVVASIHYPDGTRGSLVVLKSAITERVPVDVVRYATQNPSFPNQSTADQFFDERQFEAYREAGYAAGAGMIRENRKQNWF
jgi:hypothetical protein